MITVGLLSLSLLAIIYAVLNALMAQEPGWI
jgi:hypothetical protein